MPAISTPLAVDKTVATFTIGSVSFLNAKPLIYGLYRQDNLRLVLDVPSQLIDGLTSGRFDVALLPVIDVLRHSGLKILTAGGIGCDGPTLTVRIFSRVPVQQIRTLACDTHSHSSVALARILLAEAYEIQPRIIDLRHDDPSPEAESAEARLLIGDKVVTDEPEGFPHQIDLGQAWKTLTGLPFVFATWATRDGVQLGELPARLEASKELGLQHVDEIVRELAVPRGWPADLARQYMTEYLNYDIGARQLQAIQLFHKLAVKHGLAR